MTLLACTQEAERAHAPKAAEPEEPEQAAESTPEAEQRAVAEMQARLDAALGMLAHAQAALAAARDAAIAEVSRAHRHTATRCASTACAPWARGKQQQAAIAVTKELREGLCFTGMRCRSSLFSVSGCFARASACLCKPQYFALKH